MEEFGLTVILKLLQGLQRPIRFAHSVLMRVGTWIKSKGLVKFQVTIMLSRDQRRCNSLRRSYSRTGWNCISSYISQLSTVLSACWLLLFELLAIFTISQLESSSIHFFLTWIIKPTSRIKNQWEISAHFINPFWLLQAVLRKVWISEQLQAH